MSSSNCCFLTCIRIAQVAGKVVLYSHLFKNLKNLRVTCRVHHVKCQPGWSTSRGINVPGKMSITSAIQMTPPLWQKVKRNWRDSWWKWKRRVKKTGLKLNIQKTKIMASGPITSWEIDGETVETVSDFIFLGSKILQMVIAAMKLKDTYSLEGRLWPT